MKGISFSSIDFIANIVRMLLGELKIKPSGRISTKLRLYASQPKSLYISKNLMDAIRSLKEISEPFPFLEAEFIPPKKYHKMFVEKWYLILYQIKDQTVYVDYIGEDRIMDG